MLGSLISAGANIIGGLIGAKSAESAKDATVAQSEADRALQQEFAKQGIRWRVEDAKAAGIHPLYALGAQIPTYSPQGIQILPDDSMANAFAAAGQDISRGIDTMRTEPERQQARHLGALQIERAQLENEVIKNQLASSKLALLRQGGGTPAMPGVKTKLSELTTSRFGDPSMEAAPPSPALKEYSYPSVGTLPLPSEAVKNAIEDVLPYEIEHYYLNRVHPTLRKVFVDTPYQVGRHLGGYYRTLNQFSRRLYERR